MISSMRPPKNAGVKNTVVIGGGIAGLAAAYTLQTSGHKVTLFEQQPALGRGGTDVCNGIMCPSVAYPWADSSALSLSRSIPVALNVSTAPTHISRYLYLLEPFRHFGKNFRRYASDRELTKHLHVASFRLAQYSLRVLESEMKLTPADLYGGATGTLQLYSSRDSREVGMDKVRVRLSQVAAEGYFRPVEHADMINVEPAVAALRRREFGMHVAAGLSVAPEKLVQALNQRCLQAGVDMRIGGVRGKVKIDHYGGLIRSVGDVHTPHAVVYAAGAGTQCIAEDPLNTFPGATYVIQVPLNPASTSFSRLTTNIIDPVTGLHIAPVDGGRAVRISGYVDFQLFDTNAYPKAELIAKRWKSLLQRAVAFLPSDALLVDKAEAKVAMESYTPDSLPIIGQSVNTPNLYYLTGFGTNVATHALGGACVLRDVMNDKHAEIDPSPYHPLRIDSNHRVTRKIIKERPPVTEPPPGTVISADGDAKFGGKPDDYDNFIQWKRQHDIERQRKLARDLMQGGMAAAREGMERERYEDVYLGPRVIGREYQQTYRGWRGNR
eukprot:PhM_4_TR5754/c0_g1_i1/m.35056/K00285/dadA; D-amino-acid dehydrogenase